MRLIKQVAILLLTFIYSCDAQNPKSNSKNIVAFYNVENLFDTVDDPKTWDDDFTPKGSYRYTDKVYQQKLHNIATVINEINPDVMGLAEVENDVVLKDLVNQPELKGKYKYVWYDSPDPRGIDVAMLYKPDAFKVAASRTYAVKRPGLKTRDVLYVAGQLDGETIHLLVNHWPSRREGINESEPKRIAAAKVNKRITDSLLKQDANSNIFIMGDMNDNPDNKSIAQILAASPNKKDKKGYLYNPWAALYLSGKGTSVYHKHWDHFDQMIISGAVVDPKGIAVEKAEIYNADFIKNAKFKDGYPLRSFRGNNWNNGYSDHFPIVMYLRQ